MLIPEDQIWVVVVGFIVAFVLAFGIGANDVANSFGTSVGAKVLTLRQACLLATVMETLGAVLLGARVSDTIRKGIITLDYFAEMEGRGGGQLLMVGQLSALAGCCIWLLVATFFKVPVSATHSIVGATLGFALVVNGTSAVDWSKLGLIVGSWFISPVLSGIVSVFLFFLIRRFILVKDDKLEPGLKFLPVIYGVTITINVFSIVISGPPLLKFDKIPFWGTFVVAFGVGILVSIFVKFLMVPLQRRLILREVSELGKSDMAIVEHEFSVAKTNIPETIPEMDSNVNSTTAVDTKGDSAVKDSPEQNRIFSYLQILTAVFGSFAHGGNDVSNAIGPLVGLWLVATTQMVAGSAATPIWILLYGGFGISIGLWIWGRRVIETLGEDLTTITPSSGFCIELGAALTVLVASNIGIPISTTHCKVGSVVAVGRFRSRDNVNWKIFRNIIVAWGVTLPVSGGISALLMFFLMKTVTITPAIMSPTLSTV